MRIAESHTHCSELVISKGNNENSQGNRSKSIPLAISGNILKINKEIQPLAQMLLITGDTPHDALRRRG
jgi:hypothetical protein